MNDDDDLETYHACKMMVDQSRRITDLRKNIEKKK